MGKGCSRRKRRSSSVDAADIDHDSLVDLDAVKGGAVFGGGEACARSTGHIFKRGQRHLGGRQTFKVVQRPDGSEFLSAEHLLELENFFLFGFGNLVDFGDLRVGQFLGAVECLAFFIFADDLVFEQLLEVLVGVAANVAQGYAAFFGNMAEFLGKSRRRSSVSGGTGMRMTLPSFEGLRPRSALRMPFSIAPMIELSQG